MTVSGHVCVIGPGQRSSKTGRNRKLTGSMLRGKIGNGAMS
jgi:hypothetical protein